MAKRKIEIKTIKRWGKGGNLVALVLIFCLVSQTSAFAFRSSAGGGKIAKVNYGKIATNFGMSIGLAVVGAGVGSGMNAATPVIPKDASLATKLGSSMQGLGNFISNKGTTFDKAGNMITPLKAMGTSLGSSLNLTSIAGGYSTFVATSQVTNAVGAVGNYYGWKPSTTFIISSFSNGATAGFLNPSIALGEAFPRGGLEKSMDNAAQQTAGSIANQAAVNVAQQAALEYTMPVMLKGAITGGLGGLASSAAVVAVDGKKINQGKSVGVAGQIAGMVAGDMGTQFGRNLFNERTWQPVVMRARKEDAYQAASKNPAFQKLEAEDKALNKKINADPLYVKAQALDNAINKDFRISVLDYGKSNLAESYVNTKYGGLSNKAVSYQYSNYGSEATYVNLETGKYIPGPVFEQTYSSTNGFREEQIAGYASRYINTNASENLSLGEGLGRATKETFLGTFSSQNWPSLAARSLGIYATSRLPENKQYLSPLVNSLVVSVSHPVFGNLANVYGIDASRYFGSKTDKLEAELKYRYNFSQMALDTKMAENASKRNTAAERFNNNPNVIEVQRLENNIKGPGDISAIKAYKDAMLPNSPLAIGLKKADEELRQTLNDLSIKKGADGKILPSYDYNTLEFASFENLTPRQITNDGSASIAEIAGILAQKREAQAQNKMTDKPWGTVVKNYTGSQERNRLESLMDSEKYSLSEALNKIDMSKGKVFSTYALPGVRSGIFEGLTSGGTQALFGKMIGNSGSGNQMLKAYAANMGTAALRGVAWNLGWQNVTDTYRDEWEGDKFTTKAYNDPGYRQWEKDLGVNINSDGREMLKIEDNNKKGPSLSDALKASFAQANTEWANNALAFGRPITRYKGETGFGLYPQNISTSTFMNYVSSLRNLSSISAQDGLAAVIAHSFIQANFDAAGNNIVQTTMQIPGVPKLFSMQPERLVLTSTEIGEIEIEEGKLVNPKNYKWLKQNSPILERLTFGTDQAQVVYWSPYPKNVYVRPIPQVNEGAFRRLQGLPDDGSLNSNK